MRKLLLLRPEPGLSDSTERARAIGLEVICCPLFEVEPVAWDAPDPAGYDGVLLTSANAARHGGRGLQALQGLPVHAVGEATAAAAQAAGFRVESVGSGGARDLLASLPAAPRLLHLAGAENRDVDDARIDRRIVYRSVERADPDLPPLREMVVAVHSPRAGRRLDALAKDRSAAIIAAISQPAADSCGVGWAQIEAAAEPNDNSLLALAARLCHISSPE